MKNTALLIDTNVILDWILKRQPFHQDATYIVDLCMHRKIRGYLTVHTVLNAFYITRKDLMLTERRDLSRLLCNRFEIIGVNREQILNALDAINFKDIEDGLQMQCAEENNLDYIITRDIKDFQNSKVKVILPEDFIAMWKSTNS